MINVDVTERLHRDELSPFRHLSSSDWNASLIMQLILVLISAPSVRTHYIIGCERSRESPRHICGPRAAVPFFSSLSDDVISRDFLNTGFIHRSLFPKRGWAPNKPSPWQLQPPGMWVPFMMLLCCRNVRMRVCALNRHVFPCQQNIIFKSATFRFLAFIWVFRTLSASVCWNKLFSH